MVSLSTSIVNSADSNSDTLSTSSADSYNSQDTSDSSQTSNDLEEDVALIELNEALENTVASGSPS
jgi:hypothetical protein